MIMNILQRRQLKFSAYSTVGLVRSNNEDNLYCNGIFMNTANSFVRSSHSDEVFTHNSKSSEYTSYSSGRSNNSNGILKPEDFSLDDISETPCIFAVCDGMGGEARGELASLIAVKTLHEHSTEIKSGKIDEAVQSFISDANERLCKIMNEAKFRTGTTLALVVIAKDLVHAYNIGDSRIYKLQDGKFSCISEDHTVAAQKIKLGLLTPEQALNDKSRHVLTRCLGVFDEEMILTPYASPEFRANKNCRILLCSDGLTGMLPDEEIRNIMLTCKNCSSAVHKLVENALQNGGRDNITCIIIDC